MKDNFFSIVGTILLNNRLKKYKYYIQYAREKGYQALSLESFYKLPNRRSRKHFVLRHDVDHLGIWTRKMFETEKMLNVKSTYYFRFSTIDKELIQEMLDSGFDVGLHFETISDYARECNIKNKDEIDMELMKQRLKEDIQRFEEIIGHEIFSCCSHGAPENRVLGISNNAITEKADMMEFGLKFEAYDKKLYEAVDCHVMDGSLLYNFGFSYADTPITAIDAGHANIIFLSHPNHWYQSCKQRIRQLGAIVLGKGTFKAAERKFKRIAE